MKMRAFKPKRSAKRWLIGAPHDVIACYDNGGKTADRYSILLGGENYLGWFDPNPMVHCLALSGDPTSPLGFSQWCDAMRGPHLGKKTAWGDLPENIREHVIERIQTND